jgi:hypothetical protein
VYLRNGFDSVRLGLVYIVALTNACIR